MQQNAKRVLFALAVLGLFLASGAGAEEPNWDHMNKLNSPAYWNLWRTQNPEIQPDLRWADLSGESGYDLRDINFRQTDLSGANLQGADLSGADLTGAKLEGTKLDGAYYSDKTRFPEGFDPKQAGMRAG